MAPMKLLLMIGVLLLPPTGSTKLQDAPTGVSDFNFVFRYGSCWTNEIDTAKGKFTYDISGKQQAVADLKLTRAEMDQIEKKLESMDFWNSSKFPAAFRIPNNSNIGCGHAPLQPIYIAVTRGGIQKKLAWDDTDSACSPSPEARMLRELESLIRGVIASKPEAGAILGRETRGCA